MKSPRPRKAPPRSSRRGGAGRQWDGLRVGLLGGSFNPAHDGHLHISLEALKRLDLDYIWWLVSPQNPLKGSDGMAPLSLRIASAALAADHPRIIVTDIETRLRTRYTADTLSMLANTFPRTRFSWLMGADNLQQFDRWQAWPSIARIVPIAVFDRPNYSIAALRAKMPARFRRERLTSRRVIDLPRRRPPVWGFICCPRHPASSTAIRAGRAAVKWAAIPVGGKEGVKLASS